MPNIIDSIQLSGSSYDVRDKLATTVVELSQSEYDSLPSSAKTSNAIFVITDAIGTSVTSAVTSGSTDVVTSGGVYEALNGLKLKKISLNEYNALSPNYDSNTVYFIGDSNGYIMKIGDVSVN